MVDSRHKFWLHFPLAEPWHLRENTRRVAMVTDIALAAAVPHVAVSHLEEREDARSFGEDLKREDCDGVHREPRDEVVARRMAEVCNLDASLRDRYETDARLMRD